MPMSLFMMKGSTIKNRVLLVSGIGTLAMITLQSIGMLRFCGTMEYGTCTDSLYSLTLTLLPSAPLFLFSLLTYPLSEVVFRKWWYFVRISIPVMMVLIYITPRQSHDWMFPLEQKGLAVFVCGLFLLSLLYILHSTHKQLRD